jgi:hypothetical protein
MLGSAELRTLVDSRPDGSGDRALVRGAGMDARLTSSPKDPT